MRFSMTSWATGIDSQLNINTPHILPYTAHKHRRARQCSQSDVTWLNFSVQLNKKIRPQAAGSVKTSEVSLLLEELKMIPACWDIGHHTQNQQLRFVTSPERRTEHLKIKTFACYWGASIQSMMSDKTASMYNCSLLGLKLRLWNRRGEWKRPHVCFKRMNRNAGFELSCLDELQRKVSSPVVKHKT